MPHFNPINETLCHNRAKPVKQNPRRANPQYMPANPKLQMTASSSIPPLRSWGTFRRGAVRRPERLGQQTRRAASFVAEPCGGPVVTTMRAPRSGVAPTGLRLRDCAHRVAAWAATRRCAATRWQAAAGVGARGACDRETRQAAPFAVAGCRSSPTVG